MRFLLISALLAAGFQTSTTPQPPVRETPRVQRAARCARTAPMPMARLDGAEARYRMPVLRPDTARLAKMPTAILMPCYLIDTSMAEPASAPAPR